MCKSLNLQSSKSLYLPFYYNVFMNQVTGCKVYFSSSSEKHVCFNFQCVHVCPIVHVCPTVHPYICLCVSDSLKCVQLLDTQLSQLFMCSQFSSVSNCPSLYLSMCVQPSNSVPTQCPNCSRYPIDQVYYLLRNNSNCCR